MNIFSRFSVCLCVVKSKNLKLKIQNCGVPLKNLKDKIKSEKQMKSKPISGFSAILHLTLFILSYFSLHFAF